MKWWKKGNCNTMKSRKLKRKNNDFSFLFFVRGQISIQSNLELKKLSIRIIWPWWSTSQSTILDLYIEFQLRSLQQRLLEYDIGLQYFSFFRNLRMIIKRYMCLQLIVFYAFGLTFQKNYTVVNIFKNEMNHVKNNR